MFLWFYSLIARRDWDYDLQGTIHDWFNVNFQNSAPMPFVKPKGYFSFTITRDPVKRFVSTYRNRVLHYGELDLADNRTEKLLQRGLRGRPEINHMIAHLEDYRSADLSISHHTAPMVDFIGADLAVYDKVYDITETSQLRADLIAHWRSCGLLESLPSPGEIRREQDGGPKLGINILDCVAIERLIEFYEQDYRVFTRYSPDNARGEWQAQRAAVALPTPVDKIILHTVKSPHIKRAFWTKTPKVKDSQSGTLSHCSGTVVIEAGSGQGRLRIHDLQGEAILPWHESQHAITSRTKKPNARACKFSVADLKIGVKQPVNVLWESEQGILYPVFQITTA